jgi:hypothetical protein
MVGGGAVEIRSAAGAGEVSKSGKRGEMAGEATFLGAASPPSKSINVDAMAPIR